MVWRLLLGLVLLLALPYVRSAVYEFPDPAPFSGTAFFNPYADLHGTWVRANFHAHARAWVGLTNGQQSAQAIVRRYRGIGYDVPGISNYHQITQVEGSVAPPIYEHGFNLRKTHRLAIGAHRVTWMDFPLWQSMSHKQLVIDSVAATADVVALAHPATGYSRDDLQRLGGYHVMEIVNGPHPAMPSWDAALSSGHAVWGVANDDTHDLEEPGRLAVAWTMVNAPSARAEDVVSALKAGRSYAVWRSNQQASSRETVLTDVHFSNSTLRLAASGDPATFVFIGQNGAVRKTVHDAFDASYTFTDQDTYVRAVIRAPRTEIFLNPVFRYDGVTVPAARGRFDTAATWSLRAALLTGLAGLCLIWRRAAVRRSPSNGIRVPVGTRRTA